MPAFKGLQYNSFSITSILIHLQDPLFGNIQTPSKNTFKVSTIKLMKIEIHLSTAILLVFIFWYIKYSSHLLHGCPEKLINHHCSIKSNIFDDNHLFLSRVSFPPGQ